jgi:hypothetical protein
VQVFGLQQSPEKSPVSQKISAVQPVGVSEMLLGAIMESPLQIKTSSELVQWAIVTVWRPVAKRRLGKTEF